mmetsp:Transcript_17295/g.25740  ORF Transcript_17295/g.25740 Transcript_17295/m.25740 type:complete len:250 (+) Transcript_17295:2898-3647(+)
MKHLSFCWLCRSENLLSTLRLWIVGTVQPTRTFCIVCIPSGSFFGQSFFFQITHSLCTSQPLFSFLTQSFRLCTLSFKFCHLLFLFLFETLYFGFLLSSTLGKFCLSGTDRLFAAFLFLLHTVLLNDAFLLLASANFSLACRIFHTSSFSLQFNTTSLFFKLTSLCISFTFGSLFGIFKLLFSFFLDSFRFCFCSHTCCNSNLICIRLCLFAHLFCFQKRCQSRFFRFSFGFKCHTFSIQSTCFTLCFF